jgi:PleD family two-component response regulator
MRDVRSRRPVSPVLARADSFLYAAKNAGRNRVTTD